LLVGSRDVDAAMRIVCLLLILAMEPLSLLLVVAASRTDSHHPRQLMGVFNATIPPSSARENPRLASIRANQLGGLAP